jgi:hypothetical protein
MCCFKDKKDYFLDGRGTKQKQARHNVKVQNSNTREVCRLCHQIRFYRCAFQYSALDSVSQKLRNNLIFLHLIESNVAMITLSSNLDSEIIPRKFNDFKKLPRLGRRKNFMHILRVIILKFNNFNF